MTEPEDAPTPFDAVAAPPGKAVALASEASSETEPTAGDGDGRAEGGWTSRDFDVPESAAARIARAVPDNTRRSYASHWKQFTEWCAAAGRVARPATAETVAAYMGHLADAELAASTMAARLAAIRALHRGAGLTPPDGMAARKVIVDRARQRADDPDTPAGPRRATPLTPADLRRIVATLDLSTAAGLRDRAVILLGWAMAARRSEVAALNIADVRDAPKGLRVTVRRSKTDQGAKGTVVKIPAGKDPELCPRRAVRAWTAYLAGKNIHVGPLFVRVDRHGNAGPACGGRYTDGAERTGRLTAQGIGAIITNAAKAAGLGQPSGDPLDDDGPCRYTGHSARRGFVTTALAKKDADAAAIADHGRWTAGSRAFWDYYEPDRGWDKHPGDGLL